MHTVITYVRCNDLVEPIVRVAFERNKHQASDHPFSIYRDILFLAFTVLGRTNIDQGKIIHVVTQKLLMLYTRDISKMDFVQKRILFKSFLLSIMRSHSLGLIRHSKMENYYFTGVFDREYSLSLEKFSENDENLLHKIDAPPTMMSVYCRHYFKQLNV